MRREILDKPFYHSFQYRNFHTGGSAEIDNSCRSPRTQNPPRLMAGHQRGARERREGQGIASTAKTKGRQVSQPSDLRYHHSALTGLSHDSFGSVLNYKGIFPPPIDTDDALV
jgi:hypothetical protein